ncbi:hypothetical protein ACTA71_000632 [Dictyostelium dimigraforme]
MPQIINLETSLNDGDIETILNCCKGLGELYKYFIDDPEQHFLLSEAELKSKYITIVNATERTIDKSHISEEREYFQGYNALITQAYNILSDPHLRKIYQEQFFKELYEQEKQNIQQLQRNKILEMIKYGSLFIITPPIDLITRQLSKFQSINNNPTFSTIVKSIFKEGGLSCILRPLLFENIVGTAYILIDETFFGNAENTKWSVNPLKVVAVASTYALITYPLKFLTNVISVAPLSTPFLQIIKKIILREDQGNGLQFKNLFHAFLPSLLLYSTSKIIRISHQALVRKIQSKQKQNPDSKFYKNLSLIVCNKITEILISTALHWPLYMVRYQYANEFVQSYISNSPLPIAINPISMAIKVYKQYGLKSFFNGAITCGLIHSYSITSVPYGSASPWLLFEN